MKTSRRDLWLMLVPVLILAGVGLAVRQWPELLPDNNGPFHLRVKKVRFETLTPHEVADGYDTKVAIDYGYSGQKPSWWKANPYDVIHPVQNALKVVRFSSSQAKPLVDVSGKPVHPLPRRCPRASDNFTTRTLLALRHVPSGDEIRLRDKVVYLDGLTGKHRRLPSNTDVIVRQAREETVLPDVSTDPGIQLVRYELDRKPPVETRGVSNQWRLRLVLRKYGPEAETRNAWTELHVANPNKQPVPVLTESEEDSTHYTREIPIEELRKWEIWYQDIYFPPGVKRRKGPLWIKGKVYSSDNWPLEVRIPLLDSNGDFIQSPRPDPPFKIVAVKAHVNDVYGIVKVYPVPTTNTPFNKLIWDADYSQHVVDSHGKQYGLFRSNSGVRPPQLAFGTEAIEVGYPAAGTRDYLEYSLNLSKIPKSAGRLTFKAEISADGSKHVPVSVVVRP